MDLFDQLNPDGQKLARTPRLAKLIALLPDERLKRCTSKSAIYWEVYTWIGESGATGLLDAGLESAGARRLGFHNESSASGNRSLRKRKRQMRLARDILGVVAFEMMCGIDGTGTQPPVDRVDDTIESFRDRVVEKLKRRKTDLYTGLDDCQFNHDLECIQEMNAQGLDHLIGTFGQETIFFGDITVRNFFAAFWAARWSDAEDRRLMLNWFPDPHLGSNDKDEYREFLEIVVGLREIEETDPANYAFERETWEALFSPLYDCDPETGLVNAIEDPIRSTEWIYKTWNRMEGTAARKKFSGEFEKIIKGSDEDKKRVAMELLYVNGDPSQGSQFIRLADPEGTHTYGAEKPPVPEWHKGKDDGKFPTGGAVKQFGGETVTPFLLSRVCVTNDQFELFDPCRRVKREFTNEINIEMNIDSKDPDGLLDRHPVVNVSWYDSAVFCFWLSEYFSDLAGGNGQIYELFLPDERGWEYGCRCGLNTEFTWGDPNWDNYRIESGWCNFDGSLNDNWGRDRDRVYLRRTIDVAGEDEMLSIPSNPWGFHQLHGNVDEHCSDWIDESRGYRVFRGGSWYSIGQGCCSSDRLLWSEPTNRFRYFGLRLAAVPRAQERQVSVDADESMSRAEHESESDEVKRD